MFHLDISPWFWVLISGPLLSPQSGCPKRWQVAHTLEISAQLMQIRLMMADVLFKHTQYDNIPFKKKRVTLHAPPTVHVFHVFHVFQYDGAILLEYRQAVNRRANETSYCGHKTTKIALPNSRTNMNKLVA